MQKGVILTSLAFIVSGFAQEQAQPQFEVASVRVTPRAEFGYLTISPFGLNRFTLTNAPLDFLIELAYGVSREQISGIEKLGHERYNLNAKAEQNVFLTQEQLSPRLQSLLVERFHLRAHFETKVMDGYELVIAKGGPKLKPTASGETRIIFAGGLRLENMPLDGFASALRSPLGRPVSNKTGVLGNFDFELRYARLDDTDSALPSLFTALQSELGLRLEPAKVPVRNIVIDSVETTPTGN